MHHHLKLITLLFPLLGVGCMENKDDPEDPVYFDRWVGDDLDPLDAGTDPTPRPDLGGWDVLVEPEDALVAPEDALVTPEDAFIEAPDYGDLAEEPPLVVTFIDVGQGDAILLELPTEEVILIDGGDNGHGEDDILPLLAEKGIEHLDLMMLTHPHADHVGGLDEVLVGVEVAEVWESGEVSDTRTFQDFALARELEGATRVVPPQGYTRVYGAVTLEVLNTGGDHSDYNNDSLVVKVSYGHASLLLTGDIEIEEQRDLIADYGAALSVDLLKVPHHGSYLFDTDFISVVRPEMAVISAGEGNRYEHPHQETLDAYYAHGARVCRTDLAGTIVAQTYGAHFEYECAWE